MGTSDRRPLLSKVWGAHWNATARSLAAIGFIIIASWLVYMNSLSGPFIFDDDSSIVGNPTVTNPRHLGEMLSPPDERGVTVTSRPVLNLSLALNHAVGGTAVRGYHVTNVVVHLLAGLTLFGVMRRTLCQPRLSVQFKGAAGPVALCTAVLWVTHPLQTQAVTYIIQRAESLMGLFYLLTLYCGIRGMVERAPRRWFGLSIACCFLGMATKEVMASAPLIVLLYDRTFVAGTFRAALRTRRSYYAGLAASWLLLAYLVIAGGGNRGGSIGFGAGIGWWEHALTQFPAMLHYLRLSLVPFPLVFEYEPVWVTAAEVAPHILVVGLAVGGVLIALWRNSSLGLIGAWFFAILAPTSLMPAPSQFIVEHRMYLPLAAVAASLAAGLQVVLRRWSMAVCLAAAVPFGTLTVRRNVDYRTDLTLWGDTVSKRPGNALAHEMYAQALDRRGRTAEAIVHHETAIRLYPGFTLAHEALADDLVRAGRLTEAAEHYAEVLVHQAKSSVVHNKLGAVLAREGRVTEAIAHFEQSLRINPGQGEAHYNLANALAESGRAPESLSHYEAALRIDPGHFESRYNLANVLGGIGRDSDAVGQYEAALRLRSDSAAAHYNFANVLIKLRRTTEAIEHYEHAVRLAPTFANAHCNLGSALLEAGLREKAVAHFEIALRLEPDAVDIRERLHWLRKELVER
jgi:tetratricopeptide (TPR) repeat protein